MKKIILATTALVSVAFAGNALAQESQMMSSMGNDINIGGYYEFEYRDYSDDGDSSRTGDGNGFYSDSELFIDFASVSDAGLEYGVSLELEVINGGSRNGAISGLNDAGDAVTGEETDEASIYVAGDFGRVTLGNNDHGGDSFQTWIGTDRTYGQDDVSSSVKFADVSTTDDDESENYVAVKPNTVNAPYGDGSKITYLSPSFSGFQFGVSLEDDGVSDDDATSVGAKYDFTVYGVDVTLKAAGYSGVGHSDNSSTSYGATFGYGDFTFTAASAEFETNHDGDSRLDAEGNVRDGYTPNVEPEVLGFGLSYDINEDLFVSAYYATSEDDVTNQELSTTSVGARYTIAHGLTATAALNSFELEGAPDGNTPNPANNEGEELVLQVEFAF